MNTVAQTKANLFGSSIGLKATMAASGLVYVGFVLVHMVGNLQIFLGPEALNVYAYNLQHTGPMIGKSGAVVWGVRVLLLTCLVLHVGTAIKLKAQNRKARASRYVAHNTIQASLASRYMMLSGLVILSFIIYHLLQFTILPGTYAAAYSQTMVHPLHGVDVEMHNVYGMLVATFQIPGISIFYIFCQALLGLHLSHAVASVVQTMGFDHPRHRPNVQKLSLGYGALIFIGNSTIPLAALLGLIS